MTESEFIIKTFKESFGDSVNQRIAIYGLGKNSETIIKSFPDYNIICLLDGYRTDGILYDTAIFSLDRAIKERIEVIIIVARANSAKIIVKRIENKCRAAGIKVFDIFGHNMLENEVKFKVSESYFEFNINVVKKKIDKYDAVSFDIFDTLLTRRVLYPSDVFELIEEHSGIVGFKKMRIEVERILNRSCVPTIDEIYLELLKCGIISSSRVDEIKRLEIAIEHSVLIPRVDVVKIFNYAKEQGKKISLISDMYMGRSILEPILNSCGITGYDHIYVSCDYGMTKTSGLYEQYKKDVKADSYLHIGDDSDADINFANLNEIVSIKVMSPNDMAEISSYCKVLGFPQNLHERLMAGMVLSKIFNSPFALYHSEGRPAVGNAQNLGYLFMGPVMTGFIYWLIKVTEGKFDRILFASRDGYLVMKMYEIVLNSMPERNLPQKTYFYTSRMASIAASIKDDEDLKYASSIAFAGDLKDILRKRFFLNEKDIKEPKEGEDAKYYCERNKEAIFRRSENLRKNYLKYIQSIGIKDDERLVFFDFVSSGSCQMGTQIIMNRDISGVYFIHILESYRKKAQLKAKFYIEEGRPLELKSYMALNYEPIEGITAPHDPTLLMFDDNGKPVFGSNDRTDEEIAYIDEIQKGILDFCTEFSSIVGDTDVVIRNIFADNMYSLMRRKYSQVENCLLSSMMFQDDFTSREFKLRDMFD